MKLSQRLKRREKAEKNSPKRSRMYVLHKRQITVVALLLLVGISGYLNWSFQQDAVDPEVAAVYNQVSKRLGEAQMVSTTTQSDTSQAADSADYFAQAKMERDKKRSESMDMLTEILNAEGTDADTRHRTEEEIHLLSDFTEKEVMTENLIRAKGFSDVVVFMGENLISVAVKSDGLNEIDAAVIRDAAMSTTGYKAETVKIVEIE